MARKTLLYYLFSKNKKALYVDANGHVLEADENLKKPDGQPAHLEFSPEGWKDMLAKYARNIKWWGLFRDYTVPMKFPRDGAMILKYIMWSEGYEGICFNGIHKLDRLNLPYKYKTWYLSEINFAKYKENRTGVIVEALEGGISKYLKANENTVYEFDIDGDDHMINLLMDGMKFDFSRTFGFHEDQAVRGNDNYYLGMTEIAAEGRPSSEIEFQDVFFQSSTAPPNEQWFAKNTVAMDVQKVSGKLKIHADKDSSCNIRLEINNNDTGLSFNAPSAGVMLYQNLAIVAGQDYEVTFDTGPLLVPANYQWHIKAFGGSGVDANVQFRVNGVDITVEYVYRHPPSYVKALPAWRVFELLALKVTDNQNGWISRWLTTVRNDIAVTSGDALRGLAGAKLKTSLASFFKSFNRWGIGLGSNGGELILEKIDDFFLSSIITDIGEVSNAEITVAEDLLFNTILAGYDSQDYTDVNGKYEFNQGQQWATPGTKVVKEYDLKSAYRADPLGIELLRINFEEKKTTDSSSDNDCFMLQINKVAQHDNDLNIDFYTLYRPAYTSVTGLPHWETSFNTELTPHKSLLENGAYLRSILDLMDSQKIKFVSSDKNAELSTTLGGVTVTENEDIQIGILPAKLFRPYYITFTTQVPINLLELVDSNPYGKIQFTWNDQTWFGWLMDGGVKPATQDKQQWKLLCAPENDLSKFNKQT